MLEVITHPLAGLGGGNTEHTIKHPGPGLSCYAFRLYTSPLIMQPHGKCWVRVNYKPRDIYKVLMGLIT